MAAERDERLYLSDIVTAIDRILEYTAAGRQRFLDDQLTQDAVVRNVEIIGEAVRNLSDATRQANPHVPWSKIVGTRDRVIHGYFRVDLDIIWEVVATELPACAARSRRCSPRAEAETGGRPSEAVVADSATTASRASSPVDYATRPRLAKPP